MRRKLRAADEAAVGQWHRRDGDPVGLRIDQRGAGGRAGRRGDEIDDVVIVSVVVPAAEPALIGRAGIRECREGGEPAQQRERDDPTKGHGR